MEWAWIAGVGLAAYLLGSVPFGLLTGFLVRGVDIREHGSRNIGATNAARVLGWKWFPVVMLLDASKGFGASLAGLLLSQRGGVDLALVGGLCSLLGHFFPLYLKFRGGKGVATGLGVVLVLTALPASGWPWPGLAALGTFVLVLLVTRMISASSMVAALSLPCWYAGMVGSRLEQQPWLGRMIFFGFVAAFVIVKHRGNLKRIIKGEEPRLGRKRETTERA